MTDPPQAPIVERKTGSEPTDFHNIHEIMVMSEVDIVEGNANLGSVNKVKKVSVQQEDPAAPQIILVRHLLWP
ncbi:hypothetical protein ACTXT7_006349 [Hymenolepis weldensis]